MDPREALWRARFVAQGAAAVALATVVSTMVAAAAEVLLMLGAGDGRPLGWVWGFASLGLPALVLLGILRAQARLARYQADAAIFRLFIGGAALVLALFPAAAVYLVASQAQVDGQSLAILVALPLVALALAWRARHVAGPGPGWRPWTL